MMLDALYEHSQEFIKLKQQDYRRYFMSSDYQLTERFSILLGQRGVGKTTMIIQHLLDLVGGDIFSPKVLYIQADHFSLGNISLYEIAKEFQLMGGKYLAFDEIHKYENWSQELKSIADSFPKLKLFASGSSALEIHKGAHDLSRRAIIYKIIGMSFREYLELRNNVSLRSVTLNEILTNHQSIATDIIDTINANNDAIIPLFKEYLQYGYYPYYREFNDIIKFKMTLEQNIHTTLESDLTAIYPTLTVHSINKMKQLLIFIAKNTPYSPNYLSLKKYLDIGDERTLKNYIKYLENAGLITSVYKCSKQLAKSENPSKIYLQNPNLMHAIAHDNMNIGTAREIFFYNMLSKDHDLCEPINSDFLIDGDTVIEVGGRKKSFRQIKDHQKAYLACDNIEIGISAKIPLWLFGFLY